MAWKGRHAATGISRASIRDFSIMLIGVVIVGILMYGLLSFIAGLGGDDDGRDPVAGDTTSTSSPDVITSTTEPATTSTTTARTTSTTEATTTTAVVTTVRSPEDVRVLVLNAVGVAGLAGRVSEELSGLGYVTLEPDNHSEDLDTSRVWYRPGFGAEALELKERLVPDALVEVVPSESEYEADLVVVLGASFEE